MIPINERVYVALDVPTATEAVHLVGRLASIGVGFKIGPHFILNENFSTFITGLCSLNNGRFIDLKHLDIPETVKTAIGTTARRQFNFATIHPEENLAQAAVQASKNSLLKVLMVTHLTSFPANHDLVMERTQQAIDWGCHGVVCSPVEVASVRRMAPSGFLIVSPGVRPVEYSTDDHMQTGTPKQAIYDGADVIVVGRPVILASDPVAAVCRIIDDIKTG